MTDWFLLIFLWCIVLAIMGAMAHSVVTAEAAEVRVEPTPSETAGEKTPSPTLEPTIEPTPMPVSAAFAISRSTKLNLRGGEPKILIYHTHTTEAYTQTENYSYKETSDWRTDDQSRNVVAVGEALKLALESNYGFSVIHDTTDHEPPKLSTSYERSLITIQNYLEQYPSIVLIIDLHRDAYNVTDEPTTDYATVYSDETARLMFVVGKGTNYEDKPDFDANYALAQSITERLEQLNPKLVRPIRVKDGRYNQHLCKYSLLVEVGHNANTLEQALASVPYLAEAIALSCFGLEAGATEQETGGAGELLSFVPQN